MTGYAKLRTEHTRLAILQLLDKAGSESNLPILRAALRELGYRPVSLRGELDWLAAQGLVNITDTVPAVISLTEHGAAVAGGADVVSGVARPLPGDR